MWEKPSSQGSSCCFSHQEWVDSSRSFKGADSLSNRTLMRVASDATWHDTTCLQSCRRCLPAAPQSRKREERAVSHGMPKAAPEREEQWCSLPS